ncbi:unnamed protein product [Sphagnum jensenii]|uniref:Uncharacterized protein n=1 Tax=Sphagnum jensenii TaxID=128206 RepID=A0ABP1BNF0_9BRYO
MMCCPTHQMHPSGCRSSVNSFTRIMKKPTREDAGEGSTCDGQECVKQFWLLLWDNSMDKFCKEQAAQTPNK